MKNFSKNKFVLGLLALVSVVTCSFSAVTVDQQGVMSGSLDMAPFYGAVTVVVAALAVIVAVKAGIRLLRGI